MAAATTTSQLASKVQDRTESSVWHEKQVQLISATCYILYVYKVFLWAQGAQFGQPVSPLSLSLSLSILSAFAQGLSQKILFSLIILDLTMWNRGQC